eukprot:gene25417-31875_t
MYYLNKAVDGGALRIHNIPTAFCPNGYMDIDPLFGRLLVFRSDVMNCEWLPSNNECITITLWVAGAAPGSGVKADPVASQLSPSAPPHIPVTCQPVPVSHRYNAQSSPVHAQQEQQQQQSSYNSNMGDWDPILVPTGYGSIESELSDPHLIQKSIEEERIRNAANAASAARSDAKSPSSSPKLSVSERFLNMTKPSKEEFDRINSPVDYSRHSKPRLSDEGSPPLSSILFGPPHKETAEWINDQDWTSYQTSRCSNAITEASQRFTVAANKITGPIVAVVDALSNVVLGEPRSSPPSRPRHTSDSFMASEACAAGNARGMPTVIGRETSLHAPTLSEIEDDQLQQAIRESLLTAPKDAITEPLSPNNAKMNVCTNPWGRGLRLDDSQHSQSSNGSTSTSTDRKASGKAPPVPMKPKKPRLRFLRDLSFPDGTVLTPGTVFVKRWLVRNDGDTTWPAGIQLMHQDGDILCGDPFLQLPVDIALPANGETELSIELTAPQMEGRYVSYFTMVTKENQKFGHRLWVDILVVRAKDEDCIYSGVANHILSAHNVKQQSATQDAPFSAPVVVKGTIVSSPSVVEVVVPSKVVVPVTDPVVSASVSCAVNADTLDSSVLWQKELQLLSEMGFKDLGVNVSLLETHIGQERATYTQSESMLSSSQNSTGSEKTATAGGRGKIFHTEGIQKVIATLLMGGAKVGKK